MAKYRTSDEICRQIKAKKMYDSILKGENSVPDFDYIGKEVKINMDKYLKTKELNPLFVEFLENSVDKVFIAKQAYRVEEVWVNMYELENIGDWVFNQHSLLARCEQCGEFMNYNLYKCDHCGKEYLRKENYK